MYGSPVRFSREFAIARLYFRSTMFTISERALRIATSVSRLTPEIADAPADHAIDAVRAAFREAHRLAFLEELQR